MKIGRVAQDGLLVALGVALWLTIVAYCVAAVGTETLQHCAQFEGVSEVWCWAR